MKNLRIGTIGFLLFILLQSQSLFSQEDITENIVKPLQIPSNLSKSQNKDDWNLVDFQFKVDEIQTKIDWVNSNPEEEKKAKTEGWFDMAYKLLAKAKYDRDCHIEKFGYVKIEGFPQLIDTGNPKQDKSNYDRKLSEWINSHPDTPRDYLN